MNDSKIRMVLNATLYFIQKGQPKKDDIIRIYSTPDDTDTYTVTYKPWEYGRIRNQFTLSYMEVLNYINTVLRALENDDDPIECIQISTAMHPSVMFLLADLETVDIRNIFDDMLRAALRTNVKRIIPNQDNDTTSECSQ